MRKLILLGTLVISCFKISTAQQKKWSIQECMEYAITHNIQIQQQNLDLQDADLNSKDAVGNYLPDLNGRIRNEWNNGLSRNPTTNLNQRATLRSSNYSLGSEIPIYNGLQNYNLLQQTKMQKVASQYNIERLKDDIRINIANSYLQILLQEENLAVLNAQHTITLEQIERTKQLIDAGSLPEGDLLELQATSANEVQNIAEAENSVSIASIALKQLLNLNYTEDFSIQKIEANISDLALLDIPVENMLEKVLQKRNEIKFAEQNIIIADQATKITKGRFLPSLNGFAGLSSNEISLSNDSFFSQINDNYGFNYGLQLTVPIFSRFQTKNAVARNKVNSLRSQFQLEQAKQRVTQNVYQAYLDAKASNKSYEASKLAVSAQKRAYEYAENRFNVGISNAFDFSQAKIRYQNSQTQLIRSKYDLLFKLKLLELYYEDAVK